MHHLSLPRPFTPDLKPICSTNPFLHSHSSGSIWTTRIESGFGLGTDLGYCASAFCFCFFFYIFYSVRGYVNYRLSWMHRQLGLFSPRWTRSIVLQSVATHGKGRTGLYYVMLSNVIRPKLFDVGFDYWLSHEGTSKLLRVREHIGGNKDDSDPDYVLRYPQPLSCRFSRFESIRYRIQQSHQHCTVPLLRFVIIWGDNVSRNMTLWHCTVLHNWSSSDVSVESIWCRARWPTRHAAFVGN